MAELILPRRRTREGEDDGWFCGLFCGSDRPAHRQCGPARPAGDVGDCALLGADGRRGLAPTWPNSPRARSTSCAASWKLKHGAPSHDTFSRLFRLLDFDQFRACFQRFMASFAEACQGVVAIDGKVLRRSVRYGFRKVGVAHGLGLGLRSSNWCWRRSPPKRKSNEITAIPKLLRLLSLRGSTVHRRCAQWPARHRSADRRSGGRLCHGAQGQPAKPA